MSDNNPFGLLNGFDIDSFSQLSGSPTESSKATILNRPIKRESVSRSLMPAQGNGGPSFPYDAYQQHTGLVTGALENTHAFFGGNNFLTSDSGLDFNFNSPLTQQSSSFSSPTTDFLDASPVRGTVDPSRLSQAGEPAFPGPNVRVYNGYHSQVAAAQAAEAAKLKVEAQQRQQQKIIQQQQQQRHAAQSAKSQKPSDATLDQTISQVLNHMRQQDSSPVDMDSATSPANGQRSNSKELDEMDEDERLLNSEEGKKLSPKERRQLRNKVSARHFRKRRKELMGELEIVNQALVRENETLKMEKDKLIGDYQNLRKFVEHMISTPNFAGYMQDMVLAVGTQQSPIAAQSRQRQQSQTQHYPMATIHEQNQTIQLGDVLTEEALFNNDDGMTPFTQLNPDGTDFDMFPDTNMFVVLDTPHPPIDISTLSGKTTNFVGQQEEFDSHEEKVEVPPIGKAPEPIPKPAVAEAVDIPAAVDDEFENDPAFALYHATPAAADPVPSADPVEFDTESLSHVDIFGGIELEKVLERYELVDASEEEVGAALAMERVQRISSMVESVAARLELMTINL